VALISDPLNNVEPRPEQWLNKDFFKIEKVRSVAVTFPSETNSWKLARETEHDEWKLADATEEEQLDSSKASGVIHPLQSPNFADVAAQPEAGMETPTVVNIETFDQFTYTLKVGEKVNDNYPLTMAVSAHLPKERTANADEKPEDKDRLDAEFKEDQQQLEEKLKRDKAFENWTYLVSTWTVEPLLKERAQLLVEKQEENSAAEHPHVEGEATEHAGTIDQQP
jgi:hypothetical protein